ncbi:MAG: GTPase-associated system all-helical protein GASH, partial [Janthinobacterium lividum]
EFGSKLGVALSDALEATSVGSELEPIDVAPPLKALAQAVSVHVEKALAAFGGATAGLQRRTNLLWWKEALYSPSAHASYRDLPAFEAAGLMALDLHGLVPVYSPASVSAFLDESIRLLPASAGASEPVLTLVSEARISDAMAPLRKIAALMVSPATGRGPLLSLIGHVGTPGVLDEPSLRLFGGLGVETALSPSAWGTWLFRELQAARAVVPPSAKRTQLRA